MKKSILLFVVLLFLSNVSYSQVKEDIKKMFNQISTHTKNKYRKLEEFEVEQNKLREFYIIESDSFKVDYTEEELDEIIKEHKIMNSINPTKFFDMYVTILEENNKKRFLATVIFYTLEN